VDWSPNEARVLTASADRTAKVWDIDSGENLLTLRGHSNELTDAVWSPDGLRSVTTSYDSTARIWHSWQVLDDLETFAEQCCAVRPLTPEERDQFNLDPADDQAVD